MADNENSYFIENESNVNIASVKRVITILSDDEEEQTNKNNKRQCSTSLSKILPCQNMNKQPIIRKTRQTSLSILRTNSDHNENEERRWDLKAIVSSSSSKENLSKQKRSHLTKTKSSTAFNLTSTNTLTRTVTTPSNVKNDLKSDLSHTETLNKTDASEKNIASPGNDNSNNSSLENVTNSPFSLSSSAATTADSKSIWKRIFTKGTTAKPLDDELKKEWSELDKDQPYNRYSRFNTTNSTRICPFYKKIPGTTFCIDAFNYGSIDGINAYFLSHFHSDHYGGLNKKFSNMLYSNKITCNLCQSQLGIRSENMTILPMDMFTNVHGIEVALIDANHCPGSNMFLFRFPSGKLILHTGDFRAASKLLEHPLLKPNQIDTIYLDTTYCDVQYRFPSQDDVIQSAVQLVLNTLKENTRTLIAVGTYLIGKERIFHAIAKAIDSKIFVDAKKYRILNQLENDDLSKRLTKDPNDACVHVMGMGSITQPLLQAHLDKCSSKYSKIIGIKPTGWTTPRSTNGSKHYSIESKSSNITVYGFPYSEHSSFDELKKIIQYLKPKRIIPTVNVGRADQRDKMNGYFQQWLSV